MKAIKNGIHTDISIEDYHANETHYSSTQLKRSKRSLAEFQYHELGLDEDKRKSHFDFGNAFETALLDKDNFEEKVAITTTETWLKETMEEKPDVVRPTMTKVYKDKVEAFLKENDGKYIIKDVGDESWDTIEKMLQGCYKDSTIQLLIKNVQTQASIFWTDEQTGMNLKTRPDISVGSKRVIVDVKTLVKGDTDSVGRAMGQFNWPMQASLQEKGVIESGFMEGVDSYIWLICEKTAPFNATLYEFSPEDRRWSASDLAYEISKLSKAIEQDLFPGYSQEADNKFGILTANIPLWYRSTPN